MSWHCISYFPLKVFFCFHYLVDIFKTMLFGTSPPFCCNCTLNFIWVPLLPAPVLQVEFISPLIKVGAWLMPGQSEHFISLVMTVCSKMTKGHNQPSRSWRIYLELHWKLKADRRQIYLAFMCSQKAKQTIEGPQNPEMKRPGYFDMRTPVLATSEGKSSELLRHRSQQFLFFSTYCDLDFLSFVNKSSLNTHKNSNRHFQLLYWIVGFPSSYLFYMYHLLLLLFCE